MLNKIHGSLFTIRSLLLALLLLVYLLLAVGHAALAPLTTGPDELAHYEYVNFIATQGRPPLDATERDRASYKSDQPPLYYLVAALPASLVDPTGPPFLKRVKDHPRRQLIERTRHAWGLYNTEDERWPYQAEILRWQVGRWVSILFGAATVLVTYLIARQIFASYLPSLAAAAIVAFIPRFVLTGSMLNYETTQAFFTALFLWVLLRLAGTTGAIGISGPDDERPMAIDEGRRTRGASYALRTTHYALGLGILAGLAITAKLSAIILPVEIAAGLWLIGRHYAWGRSVWAKQLLLAALGTLLAVSWWFGFVLYQFNTVAEEGLWVGLLRPLIAADSSDATTNRLLSFLTGGQAGFTGAIDNLDSGPPWRWLLTFFQTFWAVGIEQVQPLYPSGLLTALAFCLLATTGLVHFWRGNRGASGEDANDQGEVVTDDGRATKEERQPLPTTHYALRTTPYLLLSLLLLHFLAPFVLPLIRYAVTFSLADTAQGRHVLFMAAPAAAMLMVFGLQQVARWQQNRLAELQGRSAVDYRGQRASAQGQATQNLQPNPYPIANMQYAFLLLLPGFFLLVWSSIQLWTMSWAYLPPLPVQTVQMGTIGQRGTTVRLNDAISLVSYETMLDRQRRTVRVDLWWRATAVSPIDYLTEVTLYDASGQSQTRWLGYPANGRYPTRAWDVDDTIRDTIWLPIGGLPSGRYSLSLGLVPVTDGSPLAGLTPQTPADPLSLGTIDLPESSLQVFNSILPFTDSAVAASGYTLWQQGQPLVEPTLFRYRETVLVTFAPLLPEQRRSVRIAGPAGQVLEPVYLADSLALFIVGPNWSSGDYRLQMSVSGPNQEAQQVSGGQLIRVIDRWERTFTEPPMGRRVEANFADRVKLLGYDLGFNRAEPGGGIPLTLYWQGLDWLGYDYTIFTKLLAADQTVHGGRDRLPREGYRTLYWAPNEIVSDPFGLPVAPDAPDGIYYISLGLYRQVAGQALSLPLVQDGHPIESSSVNIGPIKIGQAGAEFIRKQVEPHTWLNQPMGDGPHLTLLGYDLSGDVGRPISDLQSPTSNLQLTLYWRSEAVLPLDYTTFAQLRDEAGQVVAQKDRPPLDGAYPTSLWDPGEIIADKLVIALPPELPAGSYTLFVGLYDFQSGQRLPVPDQPNHEVALITLKRLSE